MKRNRTTSLSRIRRRRGDNWKSAMWFLLGIFAIAATLVVIDLVSTWDIIEAEQAGKLCAEMRSIFQSSGGEFGWPNCDHL